MTKLFIILQQENGHQGVTPPSRELALLVGVSRSTIQIVYEELFSRGYTVTNWRGGTRVSEWGYKTNLQEEVILKDHQRQHYLY